MKKDLFLGQIGGIVYFVSTLIFFWPYEELYLAKSLLFKIHFFIFSLSFWIICFSFIAIVLGFLLRFLNRANVLKINTFISSFIVSFFVFAGYSFYFYYFFHNPPHYPSYLVKKEMTLLTLFVLAGSFLTAIIVVMLVRFSRKIFRFDRPHKFQFKKIGRISVYPFLLFALYFTVAVFYGRASKIFIKPTIESKDVKVAVLGIDAASWNILIPLLESGNLKNLEGIMANSSYGYLDTYGEQLTPKVWTSIATGKTPEKHSVVSFSDSSHSWRAKPLWEILSDKGDKVGTVNWMNTYPALSVNGFSFTKIQHRLPDQHKLKYDKDFDISLEELFIDFHQDNTENKEKDWIRAHFNEIENHRRVLEHSNNLLSYRLLCFYLYDIDPIQHHHWDDFRQNFFRAGHSDPAAKREDVFASCWEELDRFIGELRHKLDEQTILFIVSDHGSRHVKQKEIFFALERILEVLDDLSPGVENPLTPSIIAVDEDLIEVSKEISQERVDTLCSALKEIRFWPSEKPVFESVNFVEGNDNNFIDIELTRPLKVYSKSPKRIKIKDKFFSFGDFFRLSPWSGRHRARGIIIVNGHGIHGISPGYLGSWVIDSPYFYLFRLLHGRVKHLGGFYPILKFFHLVDPMTTLDVTPSILPMLGYPVASDMDGHDLSSLFAPEIRRNEETIQSYGISAFYDQKRKLDKKERERIKEELRALGYIK